MSSLRNSYHRVSLSEEGFISRNLTLNGLEDGDPQANVNGAITPVRFFVTPLPNEIMIITNAVIHVSDSSAIKLDDYGSIVGPLANGVSFYRVIEGVEEEIGLRYRSNRELSALGPIVTRQTYANVATNTYEFDVIGSSKKGIEILGSRGDEFGIIIRDDLSTLTAHTIGIKGVVALRTV